ncbi:MAG: TIGR04053 family radical SAM/SPASM domain-containing protein [Chloroflexi bacterium]|nr:TIGR04053 family radical SAM/SPASM domain-containing protein [Chloroflexota bacterium]
MTTTDARPDRAPQAVTSGAPGRPLSAEAARYVAVDFDQTPFTLAWEMTRACALACIHCRAEAQPRRDPRELTTEEGRRLIDQVVAIGRPILVLTGGDPLMRPDIYDLAAYAVAQRLRVALSPSATRRVTRAALRRFKDLGLSMVHISLDGADAAGHDAFRGVAGSFARTEAVLRDVVDLGLPLQVGTTVTRHNAETLPAIAERVAAAGATMWSVFFLVPTGRGQAADMISAVEHERVLQWLHAHGQSAPYRVRTTAAPHYRRVVIQAMRRAHGPGPAGETPRWEATGAGYAFREGAAPVERGVNDGDGFCFVSHTGDVCPSGFLQLAAGNVRQQTLTEIYRESVLFRALRDRTRLTGRCGRCSFRGVCGGSRARAYALTGDYLAEDPACAYQPPPSTPVPTLVR